MVAEQLPLKCIISRRRTSVPGDMDEHGPVPGCTAGHGELILGVRPARRHWKALVARRAVAA